jgi:E3 ubiquitin-protein ligase ATL6/9/15/31/42/55
LINVDDDDCPTRARISGKFPRSHSTGHSLVQPGEKTERYTLRLPEEVRKQIIVMSGKLKRSSSYDVELGREGCSV